MAAADKAIEAGSVDALAKKNGQAADEAIQKHFAQLMKAKAQKDQHRALYTSNTELDMRNQNLGESEQPCWN